MAKIRIKSDKLTPFGGIFPIMEQFNSMLSSVIDSTLGLRCTTFGYQYSAVIRSLMTVYFCGGSCVEEVSAHLMPHLSLHPTLRTCSADTILRAIKELAVDNISYTSDTGKTYNFNTADRFNTLLINALLGTDLLKAGEDGYQHRETTLFCPLTVVVSINFVTKKLYDDSCGNKVYKGRFLLNRVA